MRLLMLSMMFVVVSIINSSYREGQYVLKINRIIPVGNAIILNTEDKKSFSVEGHNNSKGTIQVISDKLDTTITKSGSFDIHVKDDQNVIIKNTSPRNATIKLKIYNHSSKIECIEKGIEYM